MRKSFFPANANHSLYLIKLFTRFSYPEGNFGKNQLLDDSISLSPLYASHASDLHVNNAYSFHRDFSRLQRAHAKLIVFRVLTVMLLLRPFFRESWPAEGAAREGLPPQLAERAFTFIVPDGFRPKDLHKR